MCTQCEWLTQWISEAVGCDLPIIEPTPTPDWLGMLGEYSLEPVSFTAPVEFSPVSGLYFEQCFVIFALPTPAWAILKGILLVLSC